MNAAAVNVSSYAGAMAALKNPELVQALYEAGGAVMDDALITLHGKQHSQRRVIEFSVFSRSFFRYYEHDHFPATLAPVLEPMIAQGHADLVDLGYRITMNLTADFAGIDRPAGTTAETAALLALVKTFSEGATLVHSTRDHAAVNQEVAAAMARFDQDFLKPSIRRRQELIDALDDAATEQALPKDVLTVLLKNRARLPLSDAVLRREIAFFLQAGAHSTANALTHALHEIFQWCSSTGRTTESLLQNPLLLQRCVHESLRLHPASPVAWRRARSELMLEDATIAAGCPVIINLEQANRDPQVFGDNARQFDPDRTVPKGVWPFGLTFGYGVHACLGRDLDGGVVAKADTDPSEHQFGIVTLLVRTLLENGARPDPEQPPHPDPNTQRNNWGRYPLLLNTPGTRCGGNP